MTIKPSYIITNMDIVPHEIDCFPAEYATEAKALKAAKEKLAVSSEEEVWVWRLSHIVSKPDIDPDVEAVPAPKTSR